MKIPHWIFIVAISLVGCQSAKKYNHFNDTKIKPDKLKKDVTYLQKKFIQMHPDSDLYITKDSLNTLFENLKLNLQQPLTPKEFYREIAPIIAAVKQGHSRVVYPADLITKEENKKYKNTKGPLSQFTYKWIADTLYIASNEKKLDNTPVGSKILEINGTQPYKLYEEYVINNTSDGYNTTYLEKGFDKRFTTFFTNKFGTLDSISFVLQCQDSLFKITNHRFKVEKNKLDSLARKQSDSLKNKKILEQNISKKEQKQKFKRDKKRKKILGNINGEYNRELLFPVATDSSYAVLKIRSFNVGKYKKAYDSLFQTIQNKKITHLVLDLRDNSGGLVADIDELYSYLKTEEIPLLSESLVTSKSKLPFRIIKGWPTWQYLALAPIFPPYYAWIYLNTKKDTFGNYQFKMTGLKAKAIKSNAYIGKLDVLVNGGSFSASCIITSNLQGSKRATVFGEETGGTYNGTVAGIMPLLKLPKTKLRVRTGLMHIKPYIQTDVFGRGIFPDILTNPTTDELLFKVDSEYQEIYKQTHNQ